MTLTQIQIDTLKAAHVSGAADIMKQLAMEKIQELRASRTKQATNEETLWNLAETIGAEKVLLQFFTSLYERLQ